MKKILLIAATGIALFAVIWCRTAVERLEITFDQRNCTLTLPKGITLETMRITSRRPRDFDSIYTIDKKGNIVVCDYFNINNHDIYPLLLRLYIKCGNDEGIYGIEMDSVGKQEIIKAHFVTM